MCSAATPLDKQVRQHQRAQTVKAVKRAAGAEQVDTVVDMDLSLLNGGAEGEVEDLRLFDE